MTSFVALACIAAAFVGFGEGGLLGAITGLITAGLAGSGVAIAAGAKGTDLSMHAPVRVGQRIGGIISAVLVITGAVILGWKWGWAGGLLGYVIGIGVAFLVAGIGSSRDALATSIDGLPDGNSADPPLIPLDDFLRRTLGGRPNNMTMTPYIGAPFKCACGASHRYSSDIAVLRELPGMRLVFQCPKSDAVTCVKVKGALRFQGFESLFGSVGTASVEA